MKTGPSSPIHFGDEPIFRVLKGKTSETEAARQHDLTVGEVEGWREQFLRSAENDFVRRPKDEDALKEEQIKKLKHKNEAFVVVNDVLRETLKPHPWGREMSDA